MANLAIGLNVSDNDNGSHFAQLLQIVIVVNKEDTTLLQAALLSEGFSLKGARSLYAETAAVAFVYQEMASGENFRQHMKT